MAIDLSCARMVCSDAVQRESIRNGHIVPVLSDNAHLMTLLRLCMNILDSTYMTYSSPPQHRVVCNRFSLRNAQHNNNCALGRGHRHKIAATACTSKKLLFQPESPNTTCLPPAAA